MDMSLLLLLKPRAWSRKLRLTLIAAISLVALVFLILAPATPIGPDYHDFADKRSWLGTSNALDVLSNIPFFIVGLWGFLRLGSRQIRASFLDGRERIPYLIFFAGVMLTGVGSFWYHMIPSDSRLPWDLLPMTCSFASIVVVTYMERINLRAGFLCLAPALVLGAASVIHWTITGDYKFYLFVQFFSPVLLGLMIWLFEPRYSGIGYLATAFGLYVAAKLFEVYDYAIFRHLDRIVSGHSLKHVTAAAACYGILIMLEERHLMASRSKTKDSEILGLKTAVPS
jgi:hypothetical protein